MDQDFSQSPQGALGLFPRFNDLKSAYLKFYLELRESFCLELAENRLKPMNLIYLIQMD